jgi:outer membrane receptor protein involved in Fe transport
MVLTLLSVVGHAQTITGSVRGVISDPSGAVIPNAAVTATNLATGVNYSAQTNGDGLYSVRYLPIGRYTIAVTAKGFQDERSSAFQLEIDQEATINVPMHLQGTTAQVTVTIDATPILDTENSTLGTSIDGAMIESMPMNGRDFTAATVAVPGSIHTGGHMNEEPDVNGNREQSNSFLLDGMDIYEQMDGGGFNSNSGASYIPNPDALQEVRVITSNANAEFSNVNGGQIIAVTKSGTNALHGNALFAIQDYNMDANSWSNKHTSGTAASITPFTSSFFAGTVGGPILKNKLFFFADYQGYRHHEAGSTANNSVIPENMRNGDFSAVTGGTLHDKDGNPFTDNQIPTSMFSSVAQFLFAHPKAYPEPTITTDNVIQDNYQGPSGSYKHNNQGDFKMDWNARPSDQVSGRLSMMNTVQASTAVAIPATMPFSPGPVPYTSIVLNEVHTFSPNIINEFRAGFGRNGFLSGSPTDPSGVFGTTGNSQIGLTLPQGNTVGFTEQSIGSSITTVGDSGENQRFELNTFSYGDNLSLQRGHHLFKMGAEFVRYQTNFYYGGNSGMLGTMSYSGKYSGSGLGGPTSIADFVLGYVDQLETDEATAQFTPPGLFGQRSWRDGVFVQDDYKLRPNLTLNLGVRYDYTQPIYEVNNRETNINLKTGALELAGKNGNSRALYNPTYTNFQPRVGFAYSYGPKWVLRGGYGITSYFEGMGVNLRLTQNPPWEQVYSINGTPPSGDAPLGTPLPVTVGVPTSGTYAGGNSYKAWDPNVRPSESQEYSLTTEYQIDKTSSIRVGYVGEVTRNLTIPIWANQWPASCAGATTCPAAPFGTSLGDTAVVKETATTASMNYNALQAVYRQHGSKGLDFTANYTYSKAMTNGSNGFNGIWGTSTIWYQQNAFDLAAEYGPSPLDATHNISASLVYELPFGHGRQFAGSINPIADTLVGGWKLSGLASYFTGNPVTLGSPNNYGGQLHDVGQDRPNHLRKMHIANRSTDHWFGTDPSVTPCISQLGGGYSSGDPSTCAYSTESYTGWGTASNGSERGPGFQNIDLSLFKAFRLYEEHRIEFRADAYNAFNMTSLGNPDTGVANATFGRINGTRTNNQRTMQLTLNYKF